MNYCICTFTALFLFCLPLKSQTDILPIDTLERNDTLSAVTDSAEFISESDEDEKITTLTPAQRLMRAKLLGRKSKQHSASVKMYYSCLHHQQVKSDSSGICTVCGLELIRNIDTLDSSLLPQRIQKKIQPPEKEK
ncbi:MAG: hypothetical protein KGZ58_04595 [Ignavibacteriales bacterium]|nr:hypothetical protein [Ignavibacteriales bacterium]